MNKVWRYIKNNLISIDQSALTLIGGDPDDTFSSVAWKLYEKKNIIWPVLLIDKIFGKGHCERVCEFDEGKNAIWEWMK